MNTSRIGSPPRRTLAGLALVLLPVLAVLVTFSASAQQPTAPKKAGAKAVRDEEDEPAKDPPRSSKAKSAKQKPEEDDEPAKPAKEAAPRAPRSAAPKSAGLQPEDLSQEAEKHPQADVKQLFRELSIPYDTLQYRTTGNHQKVEPIEKFFDFNRSPRGKFDATPISKNDKPVDALPVDISKLRGIEYFEELAVIKVRNFLKLKLDTAPEGSARRLSRFNMLREAEKALTAVLNFHEAARAEGLRQGNEWNELKDKLREALLDVRLGEVNDLKKYDNWQDAEDKLERIWKEWKESPSLTKVEDAYVRFMVSNGAHLINEKPEQASQVLDRLDQKVPNRNEAKALRAKLRLLATQWFERGKVLADQKDVAGARERYEKARLIYPQMESLQKELSRLDSGYPILNVGVRELPKYFSPGLAVTELEKQSLGLIFQSLVAFRPDPARSPLPYQPCLAKSQPTIIPLGRAFELARDNYWSDGRIVTANDVRETVLHWQSAQNLGQSAEWRELLFRPNVDDSFHVSLPLQRGFLDPLALMTFWIMPAVHLPTDPRDPAFAQNPVGSGPFTVASSDPGKSVVLKANPNFRGGRSGPTIREIRFVKWTEPALEFSQDRFDLLLDVPPTALATFPPGDSSLQILPGRRITFLAVNHRRAPLQQKELRQALAHVIPRDKILDERFRGGRADLHKPLSGPYPPGSWPADANAVRFDPNSARGHVAAIKERGLAHLTLKYPADDERAQRACEDIAAAWDKLETSVKLELLPRDPHVLVNEVVRGHEYDLAYMSWDYRDDTYWLWPLFDRSFEALASGGTNYLGYQDPELAADFQRAMSHREMKEVRKWTRAIDRQIQEKLPFIPLWQLDVPVALKPWLQTPNKQPLDLRGRDPLAVFFGVEGWQLNRPKPPTPP